MSHISIQGSHYSFALCILSTADCKSLAINTLAEQWITTIDLPCMNLIIFPASACPSSLLNQLWLSTVSMLVARLLQSAVALQRFCTLCTLCFVHTHLSSWPGGHPSLVLPFAAVGVCTGVERTMLREGARSVHGEVRGRYTSIHMSTYCL